MKGFSKNLNLILVGGLIGAIVMTWIGPKIIGLVLTPPVSFGVNCEPAASYSMQKLIIAQITGLVFGILLALVAKYKFSKNKDEQKA